MSDFLMNLAMRGAGMFTSRPAATVVAPAPQPDLSAMPIGEPVAEPPMDAAAAHETVAHEVPVVRDAADPVIHVVGQTPSRRDSDPLIREEHERIAVEAEPVPARSVVPKEMRVVIPGRPTVVGPSDPETGSVHPDQPARAEPSSRRVTTGTAHDRQQQATPRATDTSAPVPMVRPDLAAERSSPDAPPTRVERVVERQPGQAIVIPAAPAAELSIATMGALGPSLSRPFAREPERRITHVRIGRIEIRAAPARAADVEAPAAPAGEGFDRYARLRTYVRDEY